jgi:hypothetical protein
MANSSITITFNEDFIVGSDIVFVGYLQSEPGTTVQFGSTWVSNRWNSGLVTTGTPTAIPGERTAINFTQAFVLDYGNDFTIVRTNANTVVITSKTIEWMTKTIYSYLKEGVYSNITKSFSNTTSVPFLITDLGFTQATDACGYARLNVTTNYLATKIISPISVVGNKLNPLFFDWLREEFFDLILEDKDGARITRSLRTPVLLNDSSFTLQISNSPNGATLTVIGRSVYGLVLKYSLDNSKWQTSNTFGGLAAGDYTLYVKDQLGCSYNKSFSVNDLSIKSPFFLYFKSKFNPIRKQDYLGR